MKLSFNMKYCHIYAIMHWGWMVSIQQVIVRLNCVIQVDSEQSQPEPFAETSLSTGKIFKDENLFSFANPMYDPNSNNVPTYKVEDVMVHVETGSSFKLRKSTLSEFWDSFKSKCNLTTILCWCSYKMYNINFYTSGVLRVPHTRRSVFGLFFT